MSLIVITMNVPITTVITALIKQALQLRVDMEAAKKGRVILQRELKEKTATHDTQRRKLEVHADSTWIQYLLSPAFSAYFSVSLFVFRLISQQYQEQVRWLFCNSLNSTFMK
jgi:hypothetical protein